MDFSSYIKAKDLISRAQTLWQQGNQLMAELSRISPEILEAMYSAGASIEDLKAIQEAAEIITPALASLRQNKDLMRVLGEEFYEEI